MPLTKSLQRVGAEPRGQRPGFAAALLREAADAQAALLRYKTHRTSCGSIPPRPESCWDVPLALLPVRPTRVCYRSRSPTFPHRETSRIP